MSKFLVRYRAPVSVREQMSSSTPEQRQAGTELWQAWAGKAGSAIVDLGNGEAERHDVAPRAGA